MFRAMGRPDVHVVVAGAGPAGLLAAINLLRRDDQAPVRYRVTLVDAGEDYGALGDDQDRKRSWMIGLSTHGLEAIRRVPYLYERYVAPVGVAINRNSFFVGGTRLTARVSGKSDGSPSTYVVDRNFIVAGLSRYLSDHYGSSGRLELLYRHRLLAVDPDTRRVLVRPAPSAGGSERYIEYDLLLGCDGVRSAVRAALVTCHRDFECSVTDTFNFFKSVHIPRPDALQSDEVAIMPQCLSHVNGIILPMTGGKVNFAAGFAPNQPCHPALRSGTEEEVSAYLRQNFRPFPLPYDEIARQWVAQQWSSTGQVHANFYHSELLKLLILGDAAHATSPSIGQGMNTALEDAAVLDELLDRHGDDLEAVLPAFSQERVKEGNALTSLSFYAYSFSPVQGFFLSLEQAARGVLSTAFPSLVSPDPISLVANGGKLSKAYNDLTRMGRLPAVRRVNDDCRRAHVERAMGMVLPKEPRSAWAMATATSAGLALVAVGAAAAVGVMRRSS